MYHNSLEQRFRGPDFRLLIDVHHSPTKEKNRERFRKDGNPTYLKTADNTDVADIGTGE
jgi:hypothetical protein